MVPRLRAFFYCLKFRLENLFLNGNFLDIRAYKCIKKATKETT